MTLHPFGEAWMAGDLDDVLSLLTDDVIFHSPLIDEPAFEGRDSVALIFAIALDAFEDLSFTHDVGDGRSHVLVGDTKVLDRPLKTTWLLELDSKTRIREVWLMVRPLTGLTALAQAIGRAIEDQVPDVFEQSKPLRTAAETFERTAARVVADLQGTRA
jgi:hypothetical protein